MEKNKKIGIWMDHSVANLITPNGAKVEQSIHSKFNSQVKEQALSRSESIMHNKEHQMHEAFYKEIGIEMLRYNHVLLFGPTSAKTELHNFINKDLHFKDIQIDIENTDKISEDEQCAFVKRHFLNKF